MRTSLKSDVRFQYLRRAASNHVANIDSQIEGVGKHLKWVSSTTRFDGWRKFGQSIFIPVNRFLRTPWKSSLRISRWIKKGPPMGFQYWSFPPLEYRPCAAMINIVSRVVWFLSLFPPNGNYEFMRRGTFLFGIIHTTKIKSSAVGF